MQEAIEALAKWVEKGDWNRDFIAVLQDHLQEALEDYGLDETELRRHLGSDAASALFACALEDFASTRFEGEENVVDAFLKSSVGRKTPDRQKAYLRGLRDSILSVYEVAESTPGETIEFRDVILGGKPVRVVETEESQGIETGSWFAARIVDMGSERRLSSTSLPIPDAWHEELSEQLKGYVSNASKEARRKSKDLIWAMDAPQRALAVAAPLITGYWLHQSLEALGIEPVFDDLDEAIDTELRFAIPIERMEEATRRLDAATRLHRSEQGWNWIPGDEGSVEGEIALDGASLAVTVDTERRGWYAQGYIMGLLDGIVGEPDVRETLPEDEADEEE